MSPPSTRRAVRARGEHLLFASILSMVAPVCAATWDWNGASGLWSDPANWTPASVPSSSAATVLRFGGSGAAAYTATNDLPAGLDVNSLVLQSTATATEKI